MADITPPSPDGVVNSYQRICLIGGPGSSKTTTATAYGRDQSEKGIYLTYDPTSPDMASVLSQDRGRLYRVNPTGKPKSWQPGQAFDWQTEAVQLALTDWRTELKDPSITFVIWDTGTTFAQKVLWQASRKKQFVGQGKSAPSLGKAGTEAELVQPTQGDYGIAQNAVWNAIIDFQMGMPYHVIVLFQEYRNKLGEIYPATVGDAQTLYLPSKFSCVLYCERVTDSKDPNKSWVQVITTPDETHRAANIKTVMPFDHNPKISLNEAPGFWTKVRAVQQGSRVEVPA